MPPSMHRFRLIPIVILAVLAPRVAAQPKPGGPTLVFSTGLTAVEKPAAGSLQLSTGGALADAGEAVASNPAAVAKVLTDLGYQAVNVTADEVAVNPAAARALAGLGGAPLVSANLYTADKKQRLFKPYVVVQALGRRIGVTGVTAVSGEPKEFAVADPAESLRDVLASLEKESDAVVLLARTDRVTAAAMAQDYPAIKLVLVSGRGIVDPQPLKVGDARVLQAPAVGGGYARAEVSFDEKHAVRQVASVVAATPEDGPDVLPAFRRAHPALPAPPALGAAVATADGGALPAKLEPGQVAWLNLRARNRAAEVGISSATLVSEYGGEKAAGRSHLLVLATQWENLIPLTLIYQKHVPTEYQIPNLADHLYVVVNGSRLARIHPKGHDLPGHVPVRSFKLPEIGARIRGNVVFEMPANVGAITSLEVRFYDYAHGHVFAPLVAAKDAKSAEDKPIVPVKKNEVLELGVFAFAKGKEIGGQSAPEGMTFVTVDLRAKSLYQMDADATAFDPKARPGAKAKVGTVADWKESRRYLQLVVDGEYGYVPAEPTRLAEEPRFLPDVMTGERVVFLAPAEAKSIEFQCDFPNAKAPGGQVIRPKGMTLALEGTRPELADAAKPTAVISDDVYRVAVNGERVVQSFGGQKPTGGGQLIVVDVTVRNIGGKGEFFQTKEQLKYAAEDGSQLPLSPATYAGPYRPADLVWIPSYERRSFQVVFETKAGDKRPRLAFTGVSMAKTVGLKPIDGATTPVAAGEPAKAPDAGVKQPEMKRPDTAKPENVAIAKADAGKELPKVETKPLKQDPATDAKALRVKAKQSHTPKGLAGVGLTPERVNQAIDRGADFLWAHLKKEEKETGRPIGSRGGHHILPMLALVHAGAHRRIPEFDQALRSYLNKVTPHDDVRQVYDAGLFCMLIEAYGDASYVPKLRECARWLLENQGKDGTWGYGTSVSDAVFKKPVVDKVLQVAGGRPLDGPGSEDEPWARMTPWEKGDDGDTSVTQYALLGLHAVSKAGVRLPAETWQRALAEHAKRQCDDGGWNYHVKNNWSYGSMTAAGVCARAIARHALGEKAYWDDEGIERGLAWLSANFTVKENPPKQYWQYYYLYALERVGRILDTEFIGPHEWYPLGAREIVANQKADGSWVGQGQEDDPAIAGSFSLLFLTRATASLDAKPKRGGPGTLATNLAVGPSLKLHVILDCSGSMLEEMDGKTKFEIAINAVTSLVKELPENTEVGLRAYGHRKRAIEPGASEDTELLIPMRKLQKDAFLAKLQGLRARGKTPLAQSLTEATRDVSGGNEENPVTVVMLTDGGEDSQPRKDPIKAAEAFAQVKGAKLQIVGFDINREDWTQQLQEMARRSGGMYLTASRPEALMRELRSAVYRTPTGFVVLDKSGREVVKGAFGEGAKLPEGQYTFRTVFAGQRFDETFWINTEGVTAVTFDATKVRPGAGMPVAEEAQRPVAQPPAQAQQQTPQPQQPTTPTSPAAAKFCTNCGNALKPDARFCTNCGQKVAK
jgi:Mg-chelatase subunit ChlD